MHADGFNASTDGGVQDNGAVQAANGIAGMVWVDAYDNTTCTQTMTNSAIQAMVQANVSAGDTGLRYEIGDEPTAFGCNAAATYRSITQAVHAIDPTAKTWVADDQFQLGNSPQSGIPMMGTVDILAFDVYPCESGPCDYSAIDSAVQQIHAAGLTNWEFIIQDFNQSPWRWPTPAEIQTQFAHWQNQGAIGYWVYAWDYVGQQVINQSGNVAALQTINALPINGSGSSSPSPSPTPTPSSNPTPSPSPSPSPSPTPPPAPPLAVQASSSGTSGTAPLTLTFTGGATGGVAPYTFAWNFGDGGSSSSQSPSHTYNAAGTYIATLRVTDSNSTQASASTGAITVRSTLIATASATPTFGDIPVTVNFTGSATGGAGSYTYSWRFGDGATSSSQNPSHVYSTAGNFSAVLTVTDGVGATATSTASIAAAADPVLTVAASPPAADVQATIAFAPTIVGGTSPFTYTWDFGDGTTARDASPSHAYTTAGGYTVLLTVIDVTGHMTNASIAVTINPAPQATASANVTNGDAPTTVNFSGAASSGTPTFTYSWSFGDGATSHGVQNPSHTYASPGSYTAVFTATDAVGQSASANVVVTVNPPPAATAQASVLAGSAPLAVNFTGTGSNGVAPYTYAWSFGDGDTSTSQSPSYTYAAAGSFTATLTITDAVGVHAVATAGPITVTGPLTATASAIPKAGDAPVTVAFFGSASGGNTPYSYAWAFGDGSTSNLQNPTHVFASQGSYTATLTVTDGQHTALAQTTVAVAPVLSAASTASAASGTAPLAATFTGTASGGTAPFTYSWNFGDGNSSTSQNPSHTFAGPGTFAVTLTISDGAGASASAPAISIVVAPGPLVATASSTATAGDAPVTATLSSTVSGGTQPYTFAWNLGDGSTSSAGSVNHSYAAAGTYTANLTVTDSLGVIAQSSVQLRVYAALSVSASAAPSSGDAPLAVAFAASAAGGLAPYTFSWTFGDGATATGQTVNHSFGAGTFHPTLTVRDAAGGAWTGTVATISPAAPEQPVSSSSSSGSSGAGTPATPPAAESSPSAAEPSPSSEPSATASASPSSQAAAPTGNGSGSGNGNVATVLVVIGSIAVSGLGGSVFLWWRRRRLI